MTNITPTITPNDARRALDELAASGDWPDSATRLGSAASSIARNVSHLARAIGLSGEDRYALMAYYLAKQLDVAVKLALETSLRSPISLTFTQPTKE